MNLLSRHGLKLQDCPNDAEKASFSARQQPNLLEPVLERDSSLPKTKLQLDVRFAPPSRTFAMSKAALENRHSFDAQHVTRVGGVGVC